jgi:RimJ/RimL family protein N-acetyltransferase
LLLRQFREDDFEAYLRIVSDPEVGRYLGGGDAPTREEAWRHMAMVAGIWTIRGYGPWAVALRTTDELVGRAGVWFPEGWPDIEVGWVFGREHWGSGFATEAGGEGLRQAFACLGVAHVTSLIHPENVASLRVAERLGGHVEKTEEFRGHEVLFYGYTSPPR